MDEEDLPLYRSISFKFLTSTAIFIFLIELILLFVSLEGMETRLFDLRETIMRGVEGIKDPETILSTVQINEIINRYAQNIIYMITLIITVVVGGLYYVVHYWFISPLKTILQSNRATTGGESIELIDEYDIPRGEIGLIMRSRNEMLNTINTLYNEEAFETLREAVDAKDEYTEGHSRRVGQIGSTLGEMLDLSEKKCEELNHSGLLHDVGKIAIDESILTKLDQHTEEEYEVIKTHPDRGEKIIQFSSISDRILEGVRHHHEQYDGSGYPDGLEGKNIPLFGRILAVPDAMDAMLSNRHYRHPLSLEEPRRELTEYSRSQFDPDVAEVAISLLKPDNHDRLLNVQ